MAVQKKPAEKPAEKAEKAEKKAPTKSQIFSDLAESTELTKKQVAAVFDELNKMIAKNLAARGPGQFTLPGLAKIVVRKKPAQPRRQVRNPASGEMVWVEKKPASKVVKVRPLKNLKDMV